VALSYEDGQFVGEVTVDAIAQVGEHFGDDVHLHAIVVTLIVEDDEGVHVAIYDRNREPD
jgi:hypothetical protein